MAFALMLGHAGFTPYRIHTSATAHIERAGEGFKITHIDLVTEAEIPGIDDKRFQEQAQAAKQDCPVSQALDGTRITLEARLLAS